MCMASLLPDANVLSPDRSDERIALRRAVMIEPDKVSAAGRHIEGDLEG